ncbi:MAG: hypothetical protein AB3N23_11160 [Paracoccaceae bacterium]
MLWLASLMGMVAMGAAAIGAGAEVFVEEDEDNALPDEAEGFDDEVSSGEAARIDLLEPLPETTFPVTEDQMHTDSVPQTAVLPDESAEPEADSHAEETDPLADAVHSNKVDSDVIEFDAKDDSLLLVWDLDADPDPDVEILPDEVEIGLSHILVNGSVLASVTGDEPPDVQDIVLVDEETAALEFGAS